MTRAELDAAGITDLRLRAAYARCRRLNAEHGRTYFLATRLLAPAQRPAVHALYGFARWMDDVVDEPGPDTTLERTAAALDAIEHTVLDGLRTGKSDDPLLSAVIDTATRYDIPVRHFEAFMASMKMDLTIEGYADRSALNVYVHGSAEVIGLQVMPVLSTVAPPEEAAPRAAALGRAFQLTNFLRDVADDVHRGRMYLPADELAAFDVDRELLTWCTEHRTLEPRVKRALADQIATTRQVYRQAKPGIAMLHPVSRPCVSTALNLYSGILDRIEDADHDVFLRRVRVPRHRKIAVAIPALSRARRARRRHATPTARQPEARARL
ncbi:phytoene/squalene synthase family protein [Amycolatopsis sp. QT-25]|uniref:phytoene/squalene synthase family protein n=1 Tax=Amycolatopsis sp. QT-25 TaxID=3034022 RepID=UPI0023EDBADA|nr:phytoene/squalene synthase family protein [Amycolatopsis sp. QT-25]WET76821.1 phytoene/squalene synthase family protein [Amycolatopsis sp. QT-25]